ncbi:hypothetical protein [Candidatus Clostridium radicumherbarum]|uniref:Uncharacterized protein n=1 Tax=Candidatus Clostridium radicumherbarum TaxID=3381662 RepID=A0ABW8TX36_9CLOT
MANKEQYKLIVQHITLIWSKRHRAAMYASVREKYPKEFEIPKEYFIHNRSYGFPIHEIIAVQQDKGFEIMMNKIKFNHYEGLIRLGGIDILLDENPVSLYYRYSTNSCGAPIRYDKKNNLLNEKAFELNTGDYGRVVYNGRFSDVDTGEWIYKKHIVNAFLSQENNQKIFIEHSIDKNYEQIAPVTEKKQLKYPICLNKNRVRV